jgi:peptide/nickel transport system ATP-binding protein
MMSDVRSYAPDDPILQMRGVSVAFGRGRDRLVAVDNVSLQVPRGGTLGVVGESGSGKSSLARSIVALTPLAGGQIVLDGEDWTSAAARAGKAFRRRVQLVFQDPRTSLNPRLTIRETLSEALAVRDVPRSHRQSEILKLFDLIGIAAATLDRYPHQFSGGQAQRIAIARALAVQPEVLLLDEVTSALDVSIQAAILNLLDEIQTTFKLSMLFISHDLGVIGAMTDMVAVMYMGRIVEYAAPASIFVHAQHPYTQALISSIPVIGGEPLRSFLPGDIPDPRNPPSGCRFHTRCQLRPELGDRGAICISRDPHDLAPDRRHAAACHFAAMADAPIPAGVVL